MSIFKELSPSLNHRFFWVICCLFLLITPSQATVGRSEIAKMLASDAQAGDYFGESVSISGNLAIVGAYLDDNAGAAYIYANTGGNTWVEQAKLVASDAQAGDDFGLWVSISGNLAIVGASGEDAGGAVAGAAYVFANTGGNTWVEQAKLMASDAGTADWFGGSVSISGNLAIVGARYEDAGAAYIYANTDGNTWVEQAKLLASDAGGVINLAFL